MRLVSLITAVIVSATLYVLVMEREMIAGLSGAVTSAEPAPQAAEPAPATSGDRRVPVLAARSLAQSVDNAVVLRGRTEAARSVEIRAETTGRVISEPLRRGARVETGEVLCRLDPGTRDATLTEARARLSEAEVNARNAARLQEGGFAAETRALAAQSALQAAQAALAAAEREMQRLELRAPFAGVLEDDTAELGALLQSGNLCGKILQLDPMRLVGHAAETDVERLEIGAMAGGRLLSGREALGEVTFVARSADPMTRTFRVEVSVSNRDGSIRDGQTVDMLIRTEGVSAHLLPGSALTLDDAGRIGVRIADDAGRARFAAVRVVRDTPEGIWVTGLPDEVVVITRGQEFVTDGVALDVTLQDNPQGAGQ